MAQSDPVNRLNEAIALINAGQRAEARTILLDLSERYPTMELAWLWLASVTEDTEERIGYLRKVLSINPNNDKARAALTRLTGTELPAPPQAATSPAPEDGPISAPTSGGTLERTLVLLLGIVA